MDCFIRESIWRRISRFPAFRANEIGRKDEFFFFRYVVVIFLELNGDERIV